MKLKTHEFAGGNCCIYSDIGGRRDNEDTVLVSKAGDNIIAVVCDGLGGQGDGKAASESVCNSLILCGKDGAFPTRESLAEAFDRANRELMSKQKNTFHMKTTAVYLCVHGNRAIWAHIGDSRLYHVYRGEICHYTLDHSASQLAVFLGNIRREDIPQDSGRSRLIHAMGSEGETPDIHEPVTLENGGHFFLLCSDGLWEYLTDEDILLACRSADAGECLSQLCRLRSERCRPECDNNSAVAVYIRAEARK